MAYKKQFADLTKVPLPTNIDVPNVVYLTEDLLTTQQARELHIAVDTVVVGYTIPSVLVGASGGLLYGEGAKIVGIEPVPIIGDERVIWGEAAGPTTFQNYHILQRDTTSALARVGDYVQNNLDRDSFVSFLGVDGISSSVHTVVAGDIVQNIAGNPVRKGTLQGAGVRLADYPQHYLTDKRFIGPTTSIPGQGYNAMVRIGHKCVMGSGVNSGGASSMSRSLAVYDSWREVVDYFPISIPAYWGHNGLAVVGSQVVVAPCYAVDKIVVYDSVTNTVQEIDIPVRQFNRTSWSRVLTVGNKVLLGSETEGFGARQSGSTYGFYYDSVTKQVAQWTGVTTQSGDMWGLRSVGGSTNNNATVVNSVALLGSPLSAGRSDVRLFDARTATMKAVSRPSGCNISNADFSNNQRNVVNNRFVLFVSSAGNGSVGATAQIGYYDTVIQPNNYDFFESGSTRSRHWLQRNIVATGNKALIISDISPSPYAATPIVAHFDNTGFTYVESYTDLDVSSAPTMGLFPTPDNSKVAWLERVNGSSGAYVWDSAGPTGAAITRVGLTTGGLSFSTSISNDAIRSGACGIITGHPVLGDAFYYIGTTSYGAYFGVMAVSLSGSNPPAIVYTNRPTGSNQLLNFIPAEVYTLEGSKALIGITHEFPPGTSSDSNVWIWDLKAGTAPYLPPSGYTLPIRTDVNAVDNTKDNENGHRFIAIDNKLIIADSRPISDISTAASGVTVIYSRPIVT